LPSLDAEIKVVIACTIIFFVLIGVYFGYDYAFVIDSTKSYSLTFGGSSTYSNDEIAVVIGNNNSSSPKTLSLYNIDNELDTRIFPSSFLSGGKEGHIIEASGIKINNTNSELLLAAGVENPVQFPFSIDNIGIGLYHGWLFVANENNSSQIPITVSTEAKLIQAVILVTAGVVAAIGFWEFLKWSDRKNAEEQEGYLTPKVATLATTYPGIAAIPNATSLALSRVQAKRAALEKRYADGNSKAKIAIVDLGSIFLGIVVSLIGLLSNSFIISVIEIDLQTAAVLLGIGLGIGSLKLFADKQ
jgi:hypothetical protein